MAQGQAAQPLIKVLQGPTYADELKQLLTQHPTASADVDDEVEKVIKPAVIADPLAPYKHGAGTPVVLGTYHKRVKEDANRGSSGGFRLLYHWDRRDQQITMLAIKLRRDNTSWPRATVAKLLKEIGKGKGKKGTEAKPGKG
jgi:mRNA-degrading endonuclease RelE of RelBE toxin-antitoxin system